MSFVLELFGRIGHALRIVKRPKPPSENVSPTGKGIIPESRPLRGEERLLLEWLIAHGEPEAQQFAQQLPQVRVVSRCTCGCPTIDLAIDESPPSLGEPSQILADLLGVSPEGTEVGVILHARQGKISELEIYSIAGTDHPFGLPRIETLKPF